MAQVFFFFYSFCKTRICCTLVKNTHTHTNTCVHVCIRTCTCVILTGKHNGVAFDVCFTIPTATEFQKFLSGFPGLRWSSLSSEWYKETVLASLKAGFCFVLSFSLYYSFQTAFIHLLTELRYNIFIEISLCCIFSTSFPFHHIKRPVLYNYF